MMNTRMRGWRASEGQLPLGAVHSMVGQAFRRADIPVVRRMAADFAARTGMGTARLADFTLAVSEAAACAVADGPHTAQLRLWTSGPRVLCEVRGNGMPWASRARAREAAPEALRRRMLRQLCDYASVRRGPDGVTVLIAMTVA